MAALSMPGDRSKDAATDTPRGAWNITWLLFLFMLVSHRALPDLQRGNGR